MDEKMKILQMLEQGKITAEEASQLLQAAGDQEKQQQTPRSGGRKLKFIITEEGSEKPKFNVAVPFALVRWTEQFIPREARDEMEEHGIDLEKIVRSADQLADTVVADITSEVTGERIQIVII